MLAVMWLATPIAADGLWRGERHGQEKVQNSEFAVLSTG